ncbi:unnamed protein product [Effrenium voratum]|nr:unnamed protein product [Effrenium voratum]
MRGWLLSACLLAHVAAYPINASWRCPLPRLPMDFPERSCLPCGATPRLRTLPAQEDFRPTKISFVNMCADVAELRWVDEQGTEHDKGDLRPGSRVVFHTFEGHVTRAYRKRDGRLLMEHMAGRSRLGDEEALEVHTKQLDAQGPPVISEDTAEGPVRGLDFREVEHGEVQGHGYHNYGFVNTLPVVVQLFWREGEQEDYEQQLALRAHLDSLAVELSVQTTALDLLRTEVALLLSRRRVRHHRDLAFRAWRLCSAPAASALPAASAPVTWEPVTRGHRSDRGRDDYTLRSATLICFFQSRDRLQHALSHWRLAVQRRGPGRALPLWRMQLCFGAWRGLLGHGCGHERLLATRRKAANALRTLRDYDLLYFVLQAWNGAVVSAALAHLDGSRREGVFQPKISGVPRDSFPRRVESPVRSGQRSPERSRRPSHLHRAFRAWRGQSAQSASEQRRLSLIAAQVRREKLLLTMHCWHKAASLERSSRTCGQVWQQAGDLETWPFWPRWRCSGGVPGCQ